MTMQRTLGLSLVAFLALTMGRPAHADGIVTREVQGKQTILRSGDVAVTVSEPSYPEMGKSRASVHVGNALVFNEAFGEYERLTDATIVPGKERRHPIVDLVLFSGGAHCCFSHVILAIGTGAADTARINWPPYEKSEFVGATWQHVGAQYLLSGGVNTGYDFSSHAGSAYAVAIFALERNGGLRVVDVTMNFPEKLRADSAEHVASFKEPDGGDAHRAAYLADEIRLGHEAAAWAFVRRSFGPRVADYAAFRPLATKWLAAQGFTAR
jgi:hypothetical protein